MTCLRLILGDQLNARHTWFRGVDADVIHVFMEVRSPESTSDEQCSYCGTRKQLLKNAKFRLGQPALGVAKVAY